MKAFRKDIRLQRYKIALNYIQKEVERLGKYNYGICLALSATDTHSRYYPSDLKVQYPELKKYQPEFEYTSDNKRVEPTNQFWWKLDEEGTKKRIEVLTEIINEMELIK